MGYVFGAYRLDTQRYELTHAGVPIPLRPKVFQVLAYLLAQHARVVSKEELLEQLWPGQFVGDVGLNSYIMAVRKALGDRRPPYQYLRTVRGHGYRFVAEVTTEEQTPPTRPTPLALARVVTPPLRGEPPGPAAMRAPVVGREAELAQLVYWWERAQGGVRHLVFVTGEPGIGKTTLVDAFLALLAGEESLWIGRGQCVEQFGVGEPYRPVLEALGRLGRGPRGQEVVTLLAQRAPTWLGQMPGLIGTAELEALQRRTAGATRERMLRELAEALEVLTVQQPLVLVLEDLHWSDPSTLDLLAVLARRREPARLLLLSTYRPPEVRPRTHPLAAVLHELHLHGHSVELPVTILAEDAIAAYLIRRLPGLPRVDALARLVHRHTEGNPLFMVTLVEAWLTQGMLREQDGAWGLQVGMEALHDQVPDSLRQMIDGQLDRLSAAEQRVLEAASVAGVEFAAAAVAAGLGQAVERVDEACAVLVRRGQWLRAIGEQSWPDGTVAGGYRFGHALYQQVLYRRVAAARRVRLHQRIGTREEVGYGAEAGARAAELAVHFAQGRDYTRAVQYLRQAGENAIQRYSYREAVACFEQALVALEHLPASRNTQEQAIDLRFHMSNALFSLGEFGRILKILSEAAPLAEAMDDRRQEGRVASLMTEYFWMMGDNDRAAISGQRALTLANTLDDFALQVRTHCFLGQTYHSLGDYPLALDVLSRVVVSLEGELISKRLGMPFLPAVFSRLWTVFCLAELGAFAEGSTRAEEAVRIAEDVDHPFSRVAAYVGVGQLALGTMDYSRAIPQLEEGLALCRFWHFPIWLPWVTSLVGSIYAVSGRLAEALPLLEEAVEWATAMRLMAWHALWVARLSEAYLRASRIEEAMAHAVQALKLSRTHKERGHEAYALRLLGEIAARRESPDAAPAEAYYRQALTLAEVLGMRPLQAHCHLGLGTLYAKTGQREQARAALSTAITLYRAMDMTFWLSQTEAALAQVCACDNAAAG
jgi:DNA-binding winged helix-turn-helix (wHTH) protein/tetratricopeptide (TPR) repeat protein